MERRASSSVNVLHCKSTEARATRAHADRRASCAEGAFGNKDPFAACAPFVEHAAVIDGEPEEGQGRPAPLWFD